MFLIGFDFGCGLGGLGFGKIGGAGCGRGLGLDEGK